MNPSDRSAHGWTILRVLGRASGCLVSIFAGEARKANRFQGLYGFEFSWHLQMQKKTAEQAAERRKTLPSAREPRNLSSA
jgi:hypothetical protein